MLEAVNNYLSYQGDKYIKPEKAAGLAPMMLDLRKLAQTARKEFEVVSKSFAAKIAPFEPERVSQWMNQAQICRPHFWCYYRQPSDSQEDVALAIRLYGSKGDFGISLEVSFVERKKAGATLTKQHKVLDLPIAEPLYYFAQENGVSHRVEGTEANRLALKEQVASGQIRKVLVKYDVPVTESMSLEELAEQLLVAFNKLLPYYEKCNENED